MANVKYFALAVAAVFIYTACARDALANNANATKAAEKTAPAGQQKVALVTLEKSAYAAWKSKDAKFWDTFLSDKFVGWGTSGKLDKVSAKKEYTGADCEIKSYALSEERVSSRGKQATLITYKATVDGTCGGQRIPANSWAAGVYVRDGGQWKAAFHAQATVVNPEVPIVKPVYQNGARGGDTAKPTAPDAGTGTLLAIEGAVWEAWKDHDAKRLSDLMAEDISFINIFGIYLANKAEALKNWSGTGCDVKSVGVTDAAATMLSPTVGILTFKATADGTCFGQKVGPIWGSSIYVKYGDAWKWTFGINVPARGDGT
jgi:ketosteroid isomerase-like protein